MNKIKISIIIVTYNSATYLVKCLDSIYASNTKFSYEIIVIDNASSDNTYGVVSPLYPSAYFIKNEENHGFAHANNQGIELATGEYYLILNPDTLINGYALDVMVDFLEAHSDAGACGCKVLNEDGSLQPSYFGFPNIMKEFGHLIRIDRMLWLRTVLRSSRLLSKIFRLNLAVLNASESVLPVDYLLGACLMLKTSVINKVGALDDNIFMYIEDTEMCHRIKANGYGVYYLPGCEITHFGGKSSETNDHRMLFEYTRSRLYFYRKCYGVFNTCALKIIIIIDMLFKMTLVWIAAPQREMQQLQTRYKSDGGGEIKPCYKSTLPDRKKAFILYGSILKMVISY